MNASYHEEFYCYHIAAKIDCHKNWVDLEDGSRWEVAEADRMQLMSWRQGDQADYIVITRNRYYSDFTFYITNQANGSYVRANLVKGPLVGGAYTLLISGMDANTHFRRSIYLSNGTSWAVSASDFREINNWQVEDPIIIGRNDDWFTSNSTLLINVLRNTVVRARKI
jgi:hypothetical protein